MKLSDEISVINGGDFPFDLLMVGAEKRYVENKYQQLIGEPEGFPECPFGAFLEDKSAGVCYQLLVRKAVDSSPALDFNIDAFVDDDYRNAILSSRLNSSIDDYLVADGFPDDVVLVVRSAVLREFAESFSEGSASAEKPLAATERNSLLKQIAALSLALAEKSNRYKRGDKPNALQTAETTMEILDTLPDASSRGVGNSSIRESIKAGLEFLIMTKQ